jgi:D-alanyl-D-alanine dipeptidase
MGERVGIAKHPRIRVMEDELLHKAHVCAEDIDPRAEKHSCMRRGVFDVLVRMIDILDEVAPSFGYEAGELEIHLFEGLRDIATQKILFDTLFEKIKREDPQLSDEEAYAQTSKFVSPYLNNVPVHSTGAAIDIHLYSNKKCDYCHMGRFNSSKGGAPTFSDEVFEDHKLHRLLLLIAATRAGLTNYVYEFWHFSYGDRYACYWRGGDHACYGSV